MPLGPGASTSRSNGPNAGAARGSGRTDGGSCMDRGGQRAWQHNPCRGDTGSSGDLGRRSSSSEKTAKNPIAHYICLYYIESTHRHLCHPGSGERRVLPRATANHRSAVFFPKSTAAPVSLRAGDTEFSLVMRKLWVGRGSLSRDRGHFGEARLPGVLRLPHDCSLLRQAARHLRRLSRRRLAAPTPPLSGQCLFHRAAGAALDGPFAT